MNSLLDVVTDCGSQARDAGCAPSIPKRAPRRTARGPKARALAAALSLLVSLGGAALVFEAYLRLNGAARFPALSNLYDFYENDGRGSIQLVAGYQGTQIVEARRVKVAINQLGMRGPEIGPRAPGERRVLILGDSFPFGHGVEAEEAFPALLAARLTQQLGTPVVVGNGGVPGAAHSDQVRDLERYEAAFDPDLIVSCVYTGNDFDGDFFGPKVAIDGYWFGTQAARLIESSWRARFCLHSRAAFVFEQFLTDHVPSLAIDRSAMEPTAEEVARGADFTLPRFEGLFMDETAAGPVVVKVLDRIEQTLDRLRQNRRMVPLVTAVIPSFSQTWTGIYELALRSQQMEPSRFERGLGAKRLAERCQRMSIPCVDLTPGMAAHPNPNSLYLPTDLHLSVEGNRFVAEQLAEQLAGQLAPAMRSAREQTSRVAMFANASPRGH